MKRLISVVDIKTLSEKGQTEFMVDDDTLITPAARDAANEFGVKIVKAAAPCCTATVPAVEHWPSYVCQCFSCGYCRSGCGTVPSGFSRDLLPAGTRLS